MSFLSHIFGTQNERILKKKIFPLVGKVNDLEERMRALSDEELRSQTSYFREKLDQGASLEDLLPEAFAVCREASRRTLKQRHYDVQIAGGIVLHGGHIAEMKTGEGKTLTATLPCYLRGLTGLGAHVVTVNEYLARRDAEWMGEVYKFLGLSVGVIVQGMSPAERKQAYGADITYGTNNEFGFDYLRDNMKVDYEAVVQRPFHFAIVDEVDSILIDEARTPLIISGDAEGDQQLYITAHQAIAGLKKDSDYVVDEKSRAVTLSEDGVSRLERRLKVENLYDPEHIHHLHHVQQALKAHVLFKKDVHYVVHKNAVVIIDEHTGRLMPGRRYGEGLHAALEAKENVQIQKETQTLASITYQNLFRMYPTLSGMTGTADTEAVEFKKIYDLDVVVIPTNKPIVREDRHDLVYRTAKEKFYAIATHIAAARQKGQPVLVGTTSVEKSELLSSLLQEQKVPHEILNAKNHSREAEIIAKAGHQGHVTLATNMAGRGTDIQLGPGTAELGGLLVIGSERHESRRIDNQLRGRSGRQGDSGASCFYLSLEDDLMRIFASDRMSALMKNMGMNEGEAIESSLVSHAIEKAQKRVEEQNFASRKHLLEYDDVMSTQRRIIYAERMKALRGIPPHFEGFAEDRLKEFISRVLAQNSSEQSSVEGDEDHSWNVPRLKKDLAAVFSNMSFACLKQSDSAALVSQDEETLLAELWSEVEPHLQDKYRILQDMPRMVELINRMYLAIIDERWKRNLMDMDHLRDSVSLRGYGQRDPLQEYKKEAYHLFSLLMMNIQETVLASLLSFPPYEELRENFAQEEERKKQLQEAREATTEPLQAADSEGGVERLERWHQGKQQPQSGVVEHRGGQDQRQPAGGMKRTAAVSPPKVGRNAPCPCGSGKKYKKCCGSNSTMSTVAS